MLQSTFFPDCLNCSLTKSKKLDLCFLQIMSVHVAGVRSNILKSNFSENNFSFTPILSCDWNWSEEQIEKRWKISQSIASTCLMKKISQSTDLHILSGVQFKCPPGHTFAPRKASPKSSSPICGRVVAPTSPLLASPMASRLHLQTVNRYHNQLCQHRHHCNHQT